MRSESGSGLPGHRMAYLRPDKVPAGSTVSLLLFAFWKVSPNRTQNGKRPACGSSQQPPKLNCPFLIWILFFFSPRNIFDLMWTRLDTENVAVSGGAPCPLENTDGVCEGKVIYRHEDTRNIYTDNTLSVSQTVHTGVVNRLPTLIPSVRLLTEASYSLFCSTESCDVCLKVWKCRAHFVVVHVQIRLLCHVVFSLWQCCWALTTLLWFNCNLFVNGLWIPGFWM